MNADAFNQMPWEMIIHQELGLFGFLDISLRPLRGSDMFPVQLIELGGNLPKLRVGRARI